MSVFFINLLVHVGINSCVNSYMSQLLCISICTRMFYSCCCRYMCQRLLTIVSLFHPQITVYFLYPDSKIRLQPYEAGNTCQLWTVQDNRIVNRVQPSLVLDIKGGNTQEGAKLISYPWRDQPNQKWILDYV